MSLEKPIEQVVEADLRALIENQVSERKTIEYKQALVWRPDERRKEFLADVSSFANAAGGHLVYGMKEEGGLPVELCGLDVDDPDSIVSTLDSSIRTGVKPRIPGVVVWPVRLENGRVAIVIRVPRSFASPHMVTFGGSSRFFSRTSNGKSQLDVHEIRAAFLLSENTAQRVKEFRAERISRILAGEAPVPLSAGPKTVVHVVPLDAFSLFRGYDSRSLEKVAPGFFPLFHSSCDLPHNLGGLLFFHNRGQSTEAYAQLFRRGIVETADASFLSERSGNKWIASQAFEEKIIEAVSIYLSALKRLVVATPVLIMLSLLGVAGYQIHFQGPPSEEPIDRDNLIIPELLVDSFECDVSLVMREPFNLIWNAAGWAGSPFYDAKGARRRSAG